MRERLTTVFAALMLLAVSATPAFAGDGATEHSVAGHTVRNDEQHETAIAFDVADEASETGRWLDPIEGEAAAVNLAVLPGGDLLYYSGVEADESQDGPTDLQFIYNATPLQGRSRVMDLSMGTGTSDADVQTPTPSHGGYYDLFCSGTSVTPGGNAVAPGATEYYTLDQDPPENLYTPLKGWNQTLLFDGEADLDDEERDWVKGPDMSQPRWYPSALQLPNGETLVASGIKTLFFPNTYNTLVETFDPDEPTDWKDTTTRIEIADGATVPRQVLPDTPNSGLAFVDETHQGLPNLPMYPRMNVIPGGPNAGEVLYAGNGDVWGPFGEHPLQPLWGHFQTLNPSEGSFDSGDATWEVHQSSPFGIRNLGANVPLMVDAEDPEPRYLSFGGTLQQSTVATPTAEIIDASEDTIQSTPTDSMTVPRWSVNGVLLPDGSVLSIGGSTYDNVAAHGSPTVGPLNLERFVPNEDGTDGEWEMLKPMEKLRAYHSTAVLLPDGRVAVGGHVPLPAFHDHQRNTLGNPQPNDTSFEIFEPSYLFHDGESRPEILPAQMAPNLQTPVGDAAGIDADFGATIDVPVDGLGDGDATLDSVTLMRPGSATHQYNADQLGIELDAHLEEKGEQTFVEVTFPDDLAIAPGHYMLFANEDVNGAEEGGFFPSQAAWVALGDVSEPAPGYGLE